MIPGLDFKSRPDPEGLFIASMTTAGLKHLRLDFNGLAALPAGLPDGLVSLHAAYNALGSLAGWAAPASLERLVLAGNWIESLRGEWSTRLRHLDLRSNYLQGSLDFQSLENLEFLDLSFNNISELDVRSLPNLRELKCSHNSLHRVQISPSLQVLALDYNGWRYKWLVGPPLLVEGYADPYVLTSLWLHRHSYKLPHFLVPTIFSTVGAPWTHQEFRANHNLLDLLPDFTEPSSLLRLFLQHNRLRSLPFRLDLLNKLQLLNVAANTLTALPDTPGPLPALEALYLSANPLDVSALVHFLDRCPALSVLHLAATNLTFLPDRSTASLVLAGWWKPWGRLRELSLAVNQLSDIPAALVDGASRLEVLLLHSNMLSRLPSRCSSRTLKELDISCNSIEKLSLDQLCSSLKRLDISTNPGLYFDQVDFQSLCAERAINLIDVQGSNRTPPLDRPASESWEQPWNVGFAETQRSQVFVSQDQGVLVMAVIETQDIDNAMMIRGLLSRTLCPDRLQAAEDLAQSLQTILLDIIRTVSSRSKPPPGLGLCAVRAGGDGDVRAAAVASGNLTNCLVVAPGAPAEPLLADLHTDQTAEEYWRDAVQEAANCCYVPPPRVGQGRLGPGATLVLASGAVWSVLRPEEAAAQAGDGPPGAAAKRIVEIARALDPLSWPAAVAARKCDDIAPGEEKYKSWEYMLEQNHKLLFTRELETLHRNLLRQPPPPAPYPWTALEAEGRYYCYGLKEQ
ncbi:PHLPP2 [Cordylochernes scorpioides]|uniref:PHLPP2 n=1 Tax=Cordylochernes scorpioides TaxID=51811 RepID=A0ABY6LUG6_9ARAC|nr:PHLPP2 [Cordylochernes scorpioides]